MANVATSTITISRLNIGVREEHGLLMSVICAKIKKGDTFVTCSYETLFSSTIVSYKIILVS